MLTLDSLSTPRENFKDIILKNILYIVEILSP